MKLYKYVKNIYIWYKYGMYEFSAHILRKSLSNRSFCFEQFPNL